MTTIDEDVDLFRTDDDRWAAVVRRDRRADGRFYYSVRTTGVYCRPACGARLPRGEHVRFHATPQDAEAAGFRACKRCRPNARTPGDMRIDAVANACRLIENAEEPPALAELARAAGLSRFHFHRLFKSVTGLTPKAYAAAHRAQRVRDGLSHGKSVTEAMYAAGFNSSGPFYASASHVLGMTPATFRGGGSGTSVHFAVGECTLGAVLVAATDKGVCAILIGDDPDALVRDLQDRLPRAELIGGDAEFERVVASVVGLVERPASAFELPLDVRGTAFAQRVWQALRQIPPGSTASYSQIAIRIGAPNATRAVARACAANAIAVAIPCHRVVRNDGTLSSYRWGVERKRALLDRENAS